MTTATREEQRDVVSGAIAKAIEPRPMLRGTLHLAMAIAAPFLLVTLVLLADSPREHVGGAIYASTLIALYTTSATYHNIPWRRPWRGVMMRLDHSMIFALIAGTYTPFCLLVVGDAWGISLLSVVWSLAGIGMLSKVAWPRAPRWLSVALYLGLGWVGVVACVPLVTNLGAPASLALAVGGIMYSVGAICYARRWPNPSPRFFGYHETFHALVVAGSITHFAVVAAHVFYL
jgi:hemolysin III